MNLPSNSEETVPGRIQTLEDRHNFPEIAQDPSPELAVSFESSYGIQRIEIKHGSTGSVLHAFMSDAEEMARRFERVLFFNLASRIRKSEVPVGFIQKIEVPSRWQGQGIGSSMISESLRIMGESGIRLVYLDAVPMEPRRMDDLVAFYERHGFVAVPDCTEEQYPEPFIMNLDLGGKE